jgi:hypothetical protein
MVGPRPDRRNFYTTGVGGRRIFRQEAYENAVGDWERRRDEEREASGGSTIYDRGAREDHEPTGLHGYADIQEGTGHVTQSYDDGYRLSRDTDGQGDEHVHWTDRNVPKGRRRYGRRHSPPPDARD